VFSSSRGRSGPARSVRYVRDPKLAYQFGRVRQIPVLRVVGGAGERLAGHDTRRLVLENPGRAD